MADVYKYNPFTGKLDNAGSASAGTVTTLSVVTNQGVSGVVANPTSTPAITLSLGALTGVTSYNGLVVTANNGTITTGIWNGTAVGVANGGTGVATFAANGVLYGNAATSVLVTAQGIANSVLTANAGAPAFSDAPVIGTSVQTPTVFGSSSSSGNLLLQSTTNATRGFVNVEDFMQVGTSTHNIAATNGYFINIATSGSLLMSTGSVTGVRFSPTVTMQGNSASAMMALFNNQAIIQDDGTARTIGTSLIFAAQNTYTATVAGGLIVNDLAGIPAYTGVYFTSTFNRTGAGTGTITSIAGIHMSPFANIGVGWTCTNYYGMLIDFPTVGGTLTNFYGIRNNGAAGANRWFLYEVGGMQSSHKGNLRLGDNTAPTTLLDLAGTLTLTSGGKATRYNNVATTGWGVPAVYASGRSTAQTAAVASVSTYTCGAADGTFLVSSNVLVTAFTAGTFTVTCAYTDESNTARTLTLNFSSLGGTIAVNIASAAAFEGIPLHIRVKASTAITIATTGTFTSLTYNVEGTITQIG